MKNYGRDYFYSQQKRQIFTYIVSSSIITPPSFPPCLLPLLSQFVLAVHLLSNLTDKRGQRSLKAGKVDWTFIKKSSHFGTRPSQQSVQDPPSSIHQSSIHPFILCTFHRSLFGLSSCGGTNEKQLKGRTGKAEGRRKSLDGS